MESIGIKELTLQNWLQADASSTKFILDNKGARNRLIKLSNKYTESILEYKLSESVPVEIRRIFEVAKGAMLYGYFFYPLFTLGLEHVCKVAESAVRVKCKKINAPTKVKDFYKSIEYLAEIKVFSDDTSALYHKFYINSRQFIIS